MPCIETLPVLTGAKMIIVDEAVDVMYARQLITGWIQYIWKKEDYDVNLLTFNDARCWHDNTLFSTKYTVHDSRNIDHKYRLGNLYYTSTTPLLPLLQRVLDETCIEENSRTTVIVDCLSTVILWAGLTKTLQFIKQLSTRVSQIVCIYRRDLVQNKIPDIMTLGTTYVRLEKLELDKIKRLNTSYAGHHMSSYIAKLSHKKLTGSVIHQEELVRQNIKTYEIESQAVVHKPNQANTSQPAKIESSFRIETNTREMEQRDKTPLPYTVNTANTSKIFYQPDDADDIDEDDPDDDLDF
ncbi:hypothetical protein DMN91_006245 [Ooceraea biroi]|uniref:Elongator complex protein 5 n=1 Tax=Ooceraea biroi TaxID=2015173 RepID=A0A026X370_OOCBI|nr:uncharacterized protein LOC105276454 [Ooceraea biroi]EZA62543.1 hypothetical protein X777_10173 [Ooceraea biroi]RLU21868.1 hypothetical protein DMN91_006245 [Ooceraea biroi]